MSAIGSEPVGPLHREVLLSGPQRVLDSALAILGSLGATGLLFVLHLYPRIPNISIVYLLVILPLASTRGRYAATLASLVAVLSFDFFLVPPLYSFQMYHAEEWIALAIFLVAALLTGHLAAALRQSAREAGRRERETRALYHLVQTASSKEEPEGQLRAISRAIVAVLAPWGVQACEILPADAGTLPSQAISSPAPAAPRPGPFSEIRVHRSTSGLRQILTPLAPLFTQVRQFFHTPPAEERRGRMDCSQHLLPLKLGQKTVGVLRVSVLGDARTLLREEQRMDPGPDSSTSFFWTFLSQVAALLERARLQRENLNLAILQRTDALRNALLSSVSHDLRTPLTAITAAATSLLQPEVRWSEEARRGFAESIVREADRLNHLVENLLDMSRIEEGALKPEKDWYSLKALIQDVLSRLEPLLAGRVIHKQLPGDLLLAEVDYMQIDQVLTNLLENAVRHTPATSPIEISAHLEGEQVVVSVADRGPGIPPEHLEHVFEKFYRVMHGPSSPEVPRGSGLGLAVCKGLVEAHNGRIWAELREGGGLIVSVQLPVGERERMMV